MAIVTESVDYLRKSLRACLPAPRHSLKSMGEVVCSPQIRGFTGNGENRKSHAPADYSHYRIGMNGTLVINIINIKEAFVSMLAVVENKS